MSIQLNARAKWALSLTEKGFAVLALLFFTGALIPILEEAKFAPEAIVRVVVPLTVLGLSGLLIARWHRQAIALVKQERLLWLLLAIALASALWSDEPTATLRRFLVLLNATSFGIYFAARYSVKEQLRLLGWTLGIAAVLSLICIWILPNYGVMGMGSSIVGELQESKHQGAWRGIYVHKNTLGSVMTLAVLVFFLLAQSSRRYRWVAWAGCSLAIALAIGSTSVLAVAILGIALVAWAFYKVLQWCLCRLRQSHPSVFPYLIIVLLFNSAVTLTFLSVFNLETILDAVGRDLTFSGRTSLWAIVLEKIWERPWFGYGHGGFWLVSDASKEVRQIFGDWAAHGHNGLLDLWLDLGLLGVSVFVYSVITVCFQAFLEIHQRPLASLWAFVYLTFLLLTNVTESALLNSQAAWFWLLYVTVVLSMHKSLATERLI